MREKTSNQTDHDILNILGRKPKTASQITLETFYAHGHVQHRLKQLAEQGRIRRQLRGRFYYYSAV